MERREFMGKQQKTTDRQIPKKKRRKASRFHMALVLFIAIVAVSGALAFMLLMLPGSGEASAEKPAVFGVHDIQVVGKTRYSAEEIIAASGIRIGQSLFSVSKVKAHDNIMSQFPYLERVDVGNSSFDTVEIKVWEVEPIGAMYANGKWLVVGGNNKGVEALEIQGDRPPRYLYFKGAEPDENCRVGGKAMKDRDFGIVTALMEAVEANGLENIGVLDVSEKTNIKLDWKGQITVLLGTENNLKDKVAALANILPEIIKNNGDTAAGQLDMRSYMEDSRAFFTPWDILNSTTTPAGAGGTTTAG